MSLLTGFELKEFDASTLTGSYQNLGTALSNPAYHIDIFNDSDVDVYISTDASTNEMRIPAGFTFPAPSKGEVKGNNVLAKGAQLSIKQVTAAGTGNIIVNVLTTG